MIITNRPAPSWSIDVQIPTYQGVHVTENWPTAPGIRGSTRPSYERLTATFDDLTMLHGSLQREIKAAITAHMQERG